MRTVVEISVKYWDTSFCLVFRFCISSFPLSKFHDFLLRHSRKSHQVDLNPAFHCPKVSERSPFSSIQVFVQPKVYIPSWKIFRHILQIPSRDRNLELIESWFETIPLAYIFFGLFWFYTIRQFFSRHYMRLGEAYLNFPKAFLTLVSIVMSKATTLPGAKLSKYTSKVLFPFCSARQVWK